MATLLWRLSEGGGIQLVVRRLADHLDQAQVALHVITARPGDLGDHLDDVPAAVHPLGYRGAASNRFARVRLGAKAARTVRRLRPDVVHVHGGMPWFWLPARLLLPTTPFLLEVHDAPGSGRHSASTDRLEGMLVRLLRLTVVCHSSSVTAEVARRWRIEAGRLVTFPLAVDVHAFRPLGDDERRKWRDTAGLAPDSALCIAVGRFVPSKRFDLAIDTLAEVRARGVEAVLVLVGGTADQLGLADRARARGVTDAVRFLGPRYGADLQAAIGAADVLLSTSEYEGFGLTLAEAAACGVPSVAMAVGGVTDIVVDGQTGRLVPPGDVEACACAVRDLLADPTERSQMGQAARARAEAIFSAEVMAARFTEVYERLAG